MFWRTFSFISALAFSSSPTKTNGNHVKINETLRWYQFWEWMKVKEICVQETGYIYRLGEGVRRRISDALLREWREKGCGVELDERNIPFSPPPPLILRFSPLHSYLNYVIHQNSSIIPPTPQEINDVWALGFKIVAKLLIV